MSDEQRWLDPGQWILDAPLTPRWKQEALPLFLATRDVGRILGWYHMYEQILDVHGDVFEFGVGHGRDLNILACLRGLLEPNVPRRFVGFDTFAGLPEQDLVEHDGPKAEPGYCATPPPEEFLPFLRDTLARNVGTHPSSDRVEFVIQVGRVQDTLPKLLEEDDTAIALAFIDYTIYEPTLFTLEAIKERLPRGAVIGFNQFKTPYWQCEARALREVFGLRAGRLRRNPFHRYWAEFVVD